MLQNAMPYEMTRAVFRRDQVTVTSMKVQVAIILANEISPLGVHKMKLTLICAVMHP